MQDKVVYLTPEGKQRFTAELRELQTVRRHEVEEQIRRAKEFSDTVDNAEYDEAKTEQSFVEGRIQELERMLAAAKLIEEPTTKADFVRMGSHIKVVDSEGDEETYYLVGSHEADPRRGLIRPRWTRPGAGRRGVAKREDGYGRIGGPKAGSRASSPGEQAAACDYLKARELGRGASRSLRLPNTSCAGLPSFLMCAALL